jgi:predicted permease
MAQHLHEFLLRLKALVLKRRMDRDMADELAFHQAMLRDKLLRQGVAPLEVDVETRRRFGRASRWHERLRELWQFRRFENLVRDVSYAARVLQKSPGFTAVAILTLALGVGANTTVFSMINGLLLRPLPVPASHELVVLGTQDSESGFGEPTNGAGPKINYSLSEPLFRGLERRSKVFTQVFGFNHSTMQVKGNNGTENVQGQIVSGGFFPALETAPLLGRTLTPADDVKGGNPAGFGVVISEGFWQRWFNRTANVMGEKLVIDNTLFTVVGVMPKRFIGADPLDRPELFVPMAAEPTMHGARNLTADGFHAWWLTVMGRLNPQATLEQANADVSANTSAILHEFIPDANWIAKRERQHFRFTAEAGSTGFTYIRLFFSKPLMAVFAMCGGILLLACLNLASLLMARGTARQKELATRLAMGATRRRLLQQLLVESFLIAVTGTVAGLAISPVVSQSISALLLGGQYETHLDTSLDLRVFAFAALAAIGAALLIGLIPALRATSGNLSDQMKHGQHTTLAFERQGMLPRVMMAVEVALALMLVVGAGLLASSVLRLYNSGTGFDPHGVENIAFSMDQQPLKGDALMQFYRQVGEGLRGSPGVKAVSFAWLIPFAHSTWDEDFSAVDGKTHNIYENSVAPEYFQTMGIPFFSGRDFSWNDIASSGRKVILNQAAAKLLLPNRNPIGQFVTKKDGEKTTRYEVIGVSGDAKYEDLRSEAPPTAYFPITQDDQETRSYNAVVRTDGPPGPLVAAAHALAEQIEPGIPMPEMTSMLTLVRDSMSAERMLALLSVFFAVCALFVTAVGLYGTLAYATERRTSEIGIRMALGARRVQVAGMVFRQNAAVALAGTAGGLIAALLASRALASFLYGTSTRDPWIFAGSIAALALIASGASLLPAVRAAGIEPMQAIRCE